MAEVAKELEDAAAVRVRGEFEPPPVDEIGVRLAPAQEIAMVKQEAARKVEEIHSR